MAPERDRTGPKYKWALVVLTYEEGSDTPVLAHTFFGKTKREALHYSESHSKTDVFYRQCKGAQAARNLSEERGILQATVREGNFKGIACESTAYWVRGEA